MLFEADYAKNYASIMYQCLPSTNFRQNPKIDTIAQTSLRASNFHCNNYCRNFQSRFNFVYFVPLVEGTKLSGIRKPCTFTNVCDTILAEQKLVAMERPYFEGSMCMLKNHRTLKEQRFPSPCR